MYDQKLDDGEPYSMSEAELNEEKKLIECILIAYCLVLMVLMGLDLTETLKKAIVEFNMSATVFYQESKLRDLRLIGK